MIPSMPSEGRKRERKRTACSIARILEEEKEEEVHVNTKLDLSASLLGHSGKEKE